MFSLAPPKGHPLHTQVLCLASQAEIKRYNHCTRKKKENDSDDLIQSLLAQLITDLQRRQHQCSNAQ